MTHICDLESTIFMFTHHLQCSSPAVRYASGFPVADDVWLYVEVFGECADTASGFYGEVEDFHGRHLITKVSNGLQQKCCQD